MIKIKFGNHKLGDDTAIFNMCSAEDCPSKKLNLCKVIEKGITCYANKAERTYPAVLPARRCQQSYWNNTSARQITQDIAERIKSRRKETRYFRFNESGDFNNQADITKLSEISKGLRTIGITTYGYTARSDLNYQDCQFYFKSSGWTSEFGTGTAIVVRNESEIPESTATETWIKCPGKEQSCAKCNICKIDTKINVAFIIH